MDCWAVLSFRGFVMTQRKADGGSSAGKIVARAFRKAVEDSTQNGGRKQLRNRESGWGCGGVVMGWGWW